MKIVIIVIAFLALGAIQHHDPVNMDKQAQNELVEQMSNVCHQGNTADCRALITKVQSLGYEVVSNSQGNYWAEVK